VDRGNGRIKAGESVAQATPVSRLLYRSGTPKQSECQGVSLEFVIVRGEKMEMQEWGRRGWPGSSPCSRNARSETPLVGRAHVGNRPGRPAMRKEEQRNQEETAGPPSPTLSARQARRGWSGIVLARITECAGGTKMGCIARREKL